MTEIKIILVFLGIAIVLLVIIQSTTRKEVRHTKKPDRLGYRDKVILRRNSSSHEWLHRKIKKKVFIGPMIRRCPGRNHAWFESNVGPIRKPCWESEDI